MPVSLAPELLESLVSTSEAANLAGVKVSAITNWRERGYLVDTVDGPKRVHLAPAGLDVRNRPLYRWIDVAKAERATRDRARRKYVSAA